jgi:hypothetical protein
MNIQPSGPAKLAEFEVKTGRFHEKRNGTNAPVLGVALTSKGNRNDLSLAAQQSDVNVSQETDLETASSSNE